METPPGKVIRSLRQALDMTQAEFARAAGWSTSTISSWERGTTQPSRLAFKTILAFAEERGVRYQPKGQGTSAAGATSSETLPMLRLGSRLPVLGREESFGSRRWTDMATHEPETIQARASSFEGRPSSLDALDARFAAGEGRFAAVDSAAARPDWHVDARLQLRLGTGVGLRRTGYVAASLLALVIGLGAGVLVRGGLGPNAAPRTDATRPAPHSPFTAKAPAPPSQFDELALAAFAAPALGSAPFAAAEAAEPAPPAKPEMPPPSMARLESIVALDGVWRASFRVGDRSVALVEGDDIGGRTVAMIAKDEVTLVGGGVAARVRLGSETPMF